MTQRSDTSVGERGPHWSDFSSWGRCSRHTSAVNPHARGHERNGGGDVWAAWRGAHAQVCSRRQCLLFIQRSPITCGHCLLFVADTRPGPATTSLWPVACLQRKRSQVGFDDKTGGTRRQRPASPVGSIACSSPARPVSRSDNLADTIQYSGALVWISPIADL